MKTQVGHLALTTGAIAAAASAAHGQNSEFSTKETRAITHAYAQCVVGRQPKKASEALLQGVDNATLAKRYPQLIIGDCLVRQTHWFSEMRFGGDLYRYALADALVSREFAQQPAPNLADVPRLPHHDVGPPPSDRDEKGKRLAKRKYEEAVKDYTQAAAYSFLSRYGECVVRSDPSGAKTLLGTTPDSPEETGRFNALRPQLAMCLGEERTLRFGKVALRGTIAINYYRLAHAAQASATRMAQ